jgi:hypothetical protein
MCARFTLRRPLAQVADELAQTLPLGLFDWDQQPRYNIAPTQAVAAVRTASDAGRFELVPLKWGLIPSSSKDAKIAKELERGKQPPPDGLPRLAGWGHAHLPRRPAGLNICIFPTDAEGRCSGQVWYWQTIACNAYARLPPVAPARRIRPLYGNP